MGPGVPMLIIRNGNVTLSNLTKRPWRPVDFKKRPWRMSLRPKKGCVFLSILGVYTHVILRHKHKVISCQIYFTIASALICEFTDSPLKTQTVTYMAHGMCAISSFFFQNLGKA